MGTTLQRANEPLAVRKHTPYSAAIYQFDRAAEQLHLPETLRRILRDVKRELIVHFPVELDSGVHKAFTGFRVQHNVARGPAKGGIRYHPDMILADARALAMNMSWKAAVVNLPFGGAMGGVICDPKILSPDELERLTRRFTTEIALLIGPDRDIPAPDVGTNPHVMAWMMDTMSMHAGHSIPAVVSGKPLAIGGSEGRHAAPGRGLTTVTLQGLRDLNMDPAKCTVAVQGFGQVGAVAAQLMAEAGMRIVAASDSRGGIFNGAGLDIADLVRFKGEGGQMNQYKAGEALSNADLLALDVDVLVPAAFELTIDAGNVDRVRARVVAEGANAGISPEADNALADRRVLVLPDILANAGGLVVSYFEWIQDIQEFFWSEAEVNARLRDVILQSYALVRDRAQQEEVTLRQAAYQIGVERVAEATAVRGIYP